MGSPEERGFEQRLLVDAAEVRGGREVFLFGPDQGLTEGDRTGAHAKMSGEEEVKTFAEFEKVGVAILVAGAGGQGHAEASADLG
jgi:hypothetical protein